MDEKVYKPSLCPETTDTHFHLLLWINHKHPKASLESILFEALKEKADIQFVQGQQTKEAAIYIA